jgi:hydroxymethylpyrimidine/phosphomethylpyrimidine kinase
MSNCPPPVLTIAGSDSSAGAGIQADLKTMAAMGCYGLNAVTSVVSEVPGKVSLLRLLDSEIIEDQVRVLFAGFPIASAKVGMLGGSEQVEAVVRAWQQWAGGVPLVVDPVMVATGGGRLLEEEAIEAVEGLLLPLARVITPNMDEAAVLWGKAVEDREAMARCATDLASRFGTAVLVKGGHLGDDRASDVLCHEGGVEWYESKRVEGVHTHGTGCSYSAAIASGLAFGLALPEAVARAKRFIAAAIEQHFEWKSATGGAIHALNHWALFSQ